MQGVLRLSSEIIFLCLFSQYFRHILEENSKKTRNSLQTGQKLTDQEIN